MGNDPACPVCGSATTLVGTKPGRRIHRVFTIRKCGGCGFAFVEDPCADLPLIYDEEYYSGRGSDPSVDYAFEFEHPGRSVRRYEWQGIVRAVRSMAPWPCKWLDFGYGNGAFVRHLREAGNDRAFGHDAGAWTGRARKAGIPILDREELAGHEGTFDVVTAIEVLEHIPDPVATLVLLRRMLKPGGLLFLTTGNAATAPRDFLGWSYVVPEIHVSYFTPESMARAMRASGFDAFFPGRTPGWNQILRFKVLKNLGFKRTSPLERAIPWPLVGPLVDWRYRVSAHPAGRAV